MRAVVLISHGFYSEALKQSIQMIAGETEKIYTVVLTPDDGPEDFKMRLKQLDSTLSGFEAILVFADLLGGTPCNTALMYYGADPRVSIITGMNLSMVLTAVLSDDTSTETLIQVGRDGILNLELPTTFDDFEDEL